MKGQNNCTQDSKGAQTGPLFVEVCLFSPPTKPNILPRSSSPKLGCIGCLLAVPSVVILAFLCGWHLVWQPL